MPLITCPTCKRNFQVDPAQSGLKLACPHCNQRVKVPGEPLPPAPQPVPKTMLASFTEQPPAPPASASPPASPPPSPWPETQRTSWWTKDKILIISIGGGLVLTLTLVLVIVLAVGGQSEYEASDILTRFEKDPAAAESHFRGRTITIKGTVLGKERVYVVGLEDRSSSGVDVLILATFMSERDVATLRRGQRITFSAEYDSRTPHAIMFRRCVMK